VGGRTKGLAWTRASPVLPLWGGKQRHKEEKVADNPTPETVSREAHQRVVSERDQFKAQAETLTRQVAEASTMQSALGAFASLRPDASLEAVLKATRVAMPHLAGLEGDALKSKVETDFDFLIPQAQAPAKSPPPDPENDPKVPTVDSTPPPGWAQPTPTGDGDSPAASDQKMSPLSPEVQEIINREGTEGLRRLDEAGLLEWRTSALPADFG